jgi:hypothetical protein
MLAPPPAAARARAVALRAREHEARPEQRAHSIPDLRRAAIGGRSDNHSEFQTPLRIYFTSDSDWLHTQKMPSRA